MKKKGTLRVNDCLIQEKREGGRFEQGREMAVYKQGGDLALNWNLEEGGGASEA